MKKFLNSAEGMVAESLRGLGLAHADLVTVRTAPAVVWRTDAPVTGKVALLSGGGSGHEPLHTGFVGHGMLDAACPGEVFTAPTPDQMLAAGDLVDGGAGLLLIVKNYTGDVMNFEMAAEMMERPTARVLVDDDVAVEDSTFTAGRRGVAGTLVVEKVVGAAAEAGADLERCRRLGEHVNGRTRSFGVALTSCTVPAVGTPSFEIGPDEIEMGVGIHGEPGRSRAPLADAGTLAAEMADAILQDMPAARGTPALVLVNGFGATPLMELHLLYEAVSGALRQRGVGIDRCLVGNYVTSLDMAGASVTLTMLDDEIRAHWDAPVRAPALRWGC